MKNRMDTGWPRAIASQGIRVLASFPPPTKAFKGRLRQESSASRLTTLGTRLRGDDRSGSRYAIDELLHGKLISRERFHRNITVA